MGYIAFVIDEDSRARLLKKFPAKHTRIIAHHVTLKFDVKIDEHETVSAKFGNPTCCIVKGYADHVGVDCVAVRVGEHVQQDNGTRFHITLSCADGVKPVNAKYPAALVKGEENGMVLTGKVEFCQ